MLSDSSDGRLIEIAGVTEAAGAAEVAAEVPAEVAAEVEAAARCCRCSSC